jgi:hypothetical protein
MAEVEQSLGEPLYAIMRLFLAIRLLSPVLPCCVCRRTSSAVYLKEPAEDGSGKQEDNKYDVLNLLEFDSTRKRMSVIVRDPAGKILLLTKVWGGRLITRSVPVTHLLCCAYGNGPSLINLDLIRAGELSLGAQ